MSSVIVFAAAIWSK